MSRRLGIVVAEGPVQRVEWFYTADGDGHRSLAEVWEHAQYLGRMEMPTAVQHVVEYVGPWLPLTTEPNQEEGPA